MDKFFTHRLHLAAAKITGLVLNLVHYLLDRKLSDDLGTTALFLSLVGGNCHRIIFLVT